MKLLLSLFLFNINILANDFFYVVKNGDTLSNITQKNSIEKIYGKNGALKKLIKINPQIKNPSLIKPGSKIQLLNDWRIIANDIPAKVPDTVPVVAAAEVVEDDGVSRYGLIEANPFLYYSRIDGTDIANGTKAIIISDINYGFNFRLSQVLSPNFRTNQIISLRRETFLADPSTTTAQIQNSTKTLTRLGLGGEYALTNRFSLLGNFAFSQELYYKGVAGSTSSIQLQNVNLNRLEFGGIYKIWERKQFNIDVEGKSIFLLPSSNATFQTRLGIGYYGRISMIQNFTNFSIRSGLFFQSLSQDTSILKSTRKDGGLDLGMIWEFGGEAGKRGHH